MTAHARSQMMAEMKSYPFDGATWKQYYAEPREKRSFGAHIVSFVSEAEIFDNFLLNAA
jgi:hypothetical protein